MADSGIDLSRYERLGDISAPFQVTKKHERRQRERAHMLEGMHCDVPPLTWEQYEAAEACPGCGRRMVTATRRGWASAAR